MQVQPDQGEHSQVQSGSANPGRQLDTLRAMTRPRPPELSYSYGALVTAAKYCGLSPAPPNMRGYWKNGWAPKHLQCHPDAVLGLNAFDRTDEYYWVARKDEEQYLKARGFRNIKAIGLPLVYVPPKVIPRMPGTLLVMPVHSVKSSTHNWREEDYVDTIDSIRSNFTEVVVCVHPSCWKKGYWVDGFTSRGYKVIKGIQSDPTAQTRLQQMFSSYEYITTNATGSLLVYGSYYGAKVSIFGPYSEYSPADFESDPQYANNPGLLEPVLRAMSEAAMRENYPELFCHPAEANERIDWARFEVGFDQRQSPANLRTCFGWNPSQRMFAAAKAAMPKSTKQTIKRIITGGRSTSPAELLKALPEGSAGQTSLLGTPLSFLNSTAFQAECTDILFEQRYRFATTKNRPRIIDCSAGTGLLALYYKAIYPNAQIVAFESDPEKFGILNENCRAFGILGIELIGGVPTGARNADRVGDDDTADDVTAELPPDSFTVVKRNARLSKYLVNEVDLLRLEVVDGDIATLCDCADQLSNVRRIVLRYRATPGSPTSLDQVLAILQKARFWVHIRALTSGFRPFLKGSGNPDIDYDMELYACRWK